MEKRFEEILAKAIKGKITDIHFKQVDKAVTISLRGIAGLVKVTGDENDLRLFNYLQYKSHLQLTSTSPQSGSFNYYFKGNYYDFRLAVITTNNTKTGVLRILNCHDGLSLDELTYDKEVQRRMLEYINKRSGLIIFSGLTGSGKTTTMYSLLRLLENKTIYSLEDPIEVVQDNITQLEINERIGFSFSEGIKQILRHNPDVLMIGEIRDENTAKMAIRAALTGCLVVSSIHSSSCSSAIHRLLELSDNKSDLENILLALFNQRLLKQKNKNQYTCIYDIYDNDDLRQYLSTNISRDKMKERLIEAERLGIIEEVSQYE